MPEQPDWIEVSTSSYDCGECGHSFLDQVFVYPGTDDERTWYACPNCGYDERGLNMPTVEDEWYQNRYSG